VVTEANGFQTITVRRNPELIAFTSPMNATGLFELDPQANMLLPFEAMGVDTQWEFKMPKASNDFDFSTIMDVVLTIDYTALHDSTYREQVLRSLSTRAEGELSWSIRSSFPDTWYGLINADREKSGLRLSIPVTAAHFPPYWDNPRIQQALVYFAGAGSETREIEVNYVRLRNDNNEFTVTGGVSRGGVISTRLGNPPTWTSLIGRSPIGTWEIEITDNENIQHMLSEGQLEDIVFVVNYEAHSPAWV
jgi:hypothetical protein